MGKKLWIALIILNFAVTFFAFNSIPRNLAYDEILLGKLALSLGKQPYTIFTSFADGHATPYFYLMLASFKLFGVTNFALRLPSALAGFLSVIVFYGIARMVFKEKKALGIPLSFVVAVIFTCLRWRINFVRFSFEMPYLLLLELFSVYFLLRFFEDKKTLFIALSGVFAGLAFHSYQPGRLFFLAPLLFLLIKSTNIKQISFYIVTFLFIAFPLILYLLMHPGSDGRVNQLNYLQNASVSIPQKAQYFASNILKTIAMFFYKGDANGRHNFPFKPALNPMLGLLFAVGAVSAIWNANKGSNNRTNNKANKETKSETEYGLFFALYLIIALIPALLTLPSENPHMLRTYTAIPAMAIFIGGIFSALENTKYRNILQGAVLLVVIAGCLYDLRTYFVFQSRVMKNSFEVTCPIER